MIRNSKQDRILIVCILLLIAENVFPQENAEKVDAKIERHESNDEEMELYQLGSSLHLERSYDSLTEEGSRPTRDEKVDHVLYFLFNYYVLKGHGILKGDARIMEFHLTRFTKVLTKTEVERWFEGLRSGEGLPPMLRVAWPEPLEEEKDKIEWQTKFAELFSEPARQ